MAQRINRRANRKSEISYQELMKITKGKRLEELTEQEWNEYGLEKLGFGSWLKRNIGNVAMGVAGAGLMLVPGGQVAGAGLLTNSVSGMVADAAEQRSIKDQNAQTLEMQRQAEVDALNQQIRNNPNNIPTMPAVMATGGTINYFGQTHEGPNGGIPVDAIGNPTPINPTALVENGEVGFDMGELGSYVFSNRLKYNKRTFANEAKRIQNKYKLYAKQQAGTFKIIDPIAEKGYMEEMMDLMEKQETLRESLARQETSKGKIDRSTEALKAVPEPSSEIPMAANGIHIDPSKRGTFKAQATKMGMSVQEAANYILSHPDKYSPAMRRKANFAKNFAHSGGGFQGIGWGEAGLSAIPGVAAGIVNLIRARQKNPYTKISLPTIQAQTINLENQRAALREQANLAQANTSRSLLNAAPTAGAYMANMTNASTSLNRNLGNALTQSYLSEAEFNAKARMQADAMNAEMKAKEMMYNSRLDNAWRNRNDALMAAGISQIGSSIVKAVQQHEQSKQDALKLNMMNPDFYVSETYKNKAGEEIANPSWFRRSFGIGRKLDIKVRPEVLEKWKQEIESRNSKQEQQSKSTEEKFLPGDEQNDIIYYFSPDDEQNDIIYYNSKFKSKSCKLYGK